MKSGIKTLAALLLTGIIVVGCGASKEEADSMHLRFRYWGDTEEVKIITALCQQFEKENPGVTVKPELKTAGPPYADALMAEFAADKAPDVMFVSTDNIEAIASSGQLGSLSPFLDKDQDIKASDYYQALMQRFSRGNDLYVLPRDIAPFAVVYYNKKLFDEAGLAYPKDDWDWEDFLQKAKKLTKRNADGTFEQLGFSDNWNLTEVFVSSAGGDLVDSYTNPTRFTFAEPAALAGIQFRFDLYHKHKVMPSASDQQGMGTGGVEALYINGHLGMFLSGIWKTPFFRKIENFDWDVAPFPMKKGAKNAHFITGGSGYGMKKNSKNPELAWKLIKHMAGKVGQTRLAATGLAQPAIKALAASDKFIDNQKPLNKKMLLKAADNSTSNTASWSKWTEFIASTWAPGMDPVWQSKYTGDMAAHVKKLQDEANQKYFGK